MKMFGIIGKLLFLPSIAFGILGFSKLNRDKNRYRPLWYQSNNGFCKDCDYGWLVRADGLLLDIKSGSQMFV